MIYHITTQPDWANAQKQGFYTANSLQTEGFIHCSTYAQVNPTLARFFNGVEYVIILKIDENLLTAPLKYEPATDVKEDFPHIFGHINLEAVIAVMTKAEFLV